MLNPKSKKKNKRKKKRLEDVLGAEQRYTPLEITLEDGTLGSPDAVAPLFCTNSCKCILFVTTMVLLLPVLVYIIVDKSGFEISIHPKQASSPQQENEPPIIVGVAQPKQAVPPPTSETLSDDEQPPIARGNMRIGRTRKDDCKQ